MNPLHRIEQEVLAQGREWTRLELEMRLQQECDAMAMECPQTGQPLNHTRWRPLTLDSVSARSRSESVTVKLISRSGGFAQHGWPGD